MSIVAQVIAVVIFIGMFVMIILDKFERHYVTLISGALVLVVVFGIFMQSPQAVFETLNVQSIFTVGFWYGASEGGTSGINWSTIIFIAGMMIMVAGLELAGFFRWICLTLAKAVHYHVVPLLVCFMCISAFLSMFIDSITVVLFLATVTLELSRLLKFDPIPMIIAEIFCGNLGGAATMCGDPPNIIIGTSLGYTFFDFISNTGLIVAICLVLCLVYFWLCFRKGLKLSEQNREGEVAYPAPSSAIADKKAFAAGVAIFVIAVVLLVTHAQTELSVAAIGVIISALTVVSTLVTGERQHIKLLLKGVDYKTLLFFIGLFVAVGGLEQTGILNMVAGFIASISGGNSTMIMLIILLLSAVCSALVDNIPFAATMIPVIRSISAVQGIDLHMLAWTLSLGTDLGGNATPIGASANVVGTSIAAKNGHPISWGKYCKYCIPATILVIGTSFLCLYFKYL